MNPMLRPAFLVLLIASAAGAQTRRDVVKGRVTTDSGAAVVDADVIVTMAPSREIIRGKSDASGNYEIVLANGSGEYLLYIGAVGRVPLRRRLTAAGPDTTFIVDAKLAAVPATSLAAVRSVAARPRPPRTSGIDASVTGATAGDRAPDGAFGQISPDLAGNLEAMASVIPGFALTPGGLSAGGVTGSNLSTLNGLAMGAELPRDAKTTARFQTSPWDPTRGGFAGAQIGISLASGTALDYRRARITLDDPGIQLGQPGARALGQKYRGGILGIGGDGPIVPQKYFYNYAAEVARTTTPVASLIDLDSVTLAQNGVAADSAERILEAASLKGIPSSLSGIPGDRQTTSGSFIARFDRSSQPSRTPGGVGSAPFWILTTASVRQSDALSLSPSIIPTSTSRQRNVTGGLQAFTSTYTGPGRLWLNETMFALSGSVNNSDPYLGIPSGSVRVASALDDGTSTVRSLSIGGGSSPRRDASWSAEGVNNTTFYPRSKASRPIKLHLTARYDAFDQMIGGSRLGAYSFASIADFENDTPSSFSRALRTPDRTGGEVTAASALGFNWTLGTKLNLIGGLRAEGNVFTATPAANPAVKSAFGLETDHVPNTFAISPRLGFSWTFRTGTAASFGRTATSYFAPVSVRGGMGRFRSRPAATLIADALTGTGLSGSSLQISCFGPAAPTPNWSGYVAGTAAIPDACAPGFDPVYSDTAANVVAFARNYAPQDAWRANLGATRSFGKAYVSVDGFYSLNLGQPTSFDRNFSGVSRFSLSSEANRSVYVSETSIVPSSGVVSPVESRMASAFGRVIERRSDMRSELKQVIVHTLPNTSWFDPFLSVDYIYSDVRTKRRGFDGSTSGDPRQAEWMRDSYTARHQINLQSGKYYKGVSLAGILILRSGVRYTPMISGDVNGDGLSNDRAFVAGTTIPASATERVRECLSAQQGKVAAPNSCSGPWTATMNALLTANPNPPLLVRRLTMSLNFANPLALFDRVLHGPDDLRGWGSQSYPDNTLLYVRGYDAAAHAYRYEVNERFGSTSPRTNQLLNPFRVTLDVRINFGRPVERQQLDITLRPPRGEAGTRASADTIRLRLETAGGAQGPQDVYGAVMYLSDSLALSADQIRRLEEARIPFRSKVDSIYTVLADYLASMPAAFDGALASQKIRDAGTAAWKIMSEQGKPIQSILTPVQMQLLNPTLIATLTRPNYQGRWSGMFGSRWVPLR